MSKVRNSPNERLYAETYLSQWNQRIAVFRFGRSKNSSRQKGVTDCFHSNIFLGSPQMSRLTYYRLKPAPTHLDQIMRMNLCDPGATPLATPLQHDGMPQLGYLILPLSKLRPYVSVEYFYILDSI